MLRDASELTERQLREAVAVAEDRFAAGDLAGALAGLEAVRRAAATGSRLWAEAMADVAVVLHAMDAPQDALAHARHALRAAPDLEEAGETAEVSAAALGLADAPRRGDRILVVVDNFFPSRGGTEVLAEDLAVSLTRLGHPVEILCRAHPQREPGWRGIPVHEMQPAFADRALAELLASGRFGAVIGISVPMGFPVLGILRAPHLLAGIRSLVVPCVNEEVDATVRSSPDFLRDYARMLFRVDAVGFSSHGGWDRRLLDDLGVPGVYLPNAVPGVEQSGCLREELEVSRSTPIILHVANFWPQKNHLAFLEQLRVTAGDWRLVCIGGPSSDHPGLAREVAVAAARDPRVKLLGVRTREEVAGAMLQSDLLVLPSIAEATPLVLLEAMSNRLPWIASDTCGSASDLAGGTIVARDGFAGEIQRLLADPTARMALATAGRVAYEIGYSWDAVAPRYLAALALDGADGVRLAAAS